MNTKTTRLDKFLSNRGVASRREIKRFLKNNEVTVAGKRAKESGIRVEENDTVLVNGEALKNEELRYFMLNKPIGIISTVSDEFGRKNVVSLVKSDVRVYPVGRLDKDTSGLILLTNDGALTHRLTHPKFHVPKKYLLTVQGQVPQEKLKQFRNGVILSDGITNPAEIEVLNGGERSTLAVLLMEGRYRQIRRMCEALEINLLELERVQFGPIKLGSLKKGEFREIKDAEVVKLKKAAGIEI